jgi:hypothetical protein
MSDETRSFVQTGSGQALAKLNKRTAFLAGSVLDAASDVARFLLIRGTYSVIGTGWVGCEPDDGVEGKKRRFCDAILY